MRKDEEVGAGAAVGLWQSREEVSKEGLMAHRQVEVKGVLENKRKEEVDVALRRY